MPSNERRGGGREGEPPNFGRGYDQLQKSLEKALKKSHDAGTPFDAESVMPREVFDTLNDDTNLTAAGWDNLRKDYYERRPDTDAASPSAPAIAKEAPAPHSEASADAPTDAPDDRPKKKSLRAQRREEERRAADYAAASQPAPRQKEPARKEAAGEPTREKEPAGPKPHEYVVKKTRDGFEMAKRGGEGSENRTFPTNVVLKENLVARLEKDPAFAADIESEANRLRKEWRNRRNLMVDLPHLDGIEWGTEDEIAQQLAELMHDPKDFEVTATYNDRGRKKTNRIPAAEVFPGDTLYNVLDKMPKRSPADPEAQADWEKWGNGLFRNGVIDFIVSEELARNYVEPTEASVKGKDTAPPNLPTADSAATVSYGPAERTTPAPETRLSHLLAASAGPSGPPESVDDLDMRWKQENPDDANHPILKKREKIDITIKEPAPTEPPPLPKKKPSEPPPLPKKPESVKPAPMPEASDMATEDLVEDVTDMEVVEVKPEPVPAPPKAPEKAPEATKPIEVPKTVEVRSEEKERAAARAAVGVTLEKVAKAIPELGEKLAAPGLREFMTGWYANLFTRKGVTDAERAAFGLVYDAKTNKVVVKMKTFRNTVDALKDIHEEAGA